MNPESNSTTPVLDPTSTAPAPDSRSPKATAKDNPSRCLHRYENGTRCRTRGLPSQAGLCIRHFNLKVAAGLPLVPAPSDFEDLSADLLPEPSEFDGALPINQFLSRLLVLLTKGCVTPRRAAVLAYITNQILHSHRAIHRELDSHDEEPQIIIDMPRPGCGDLADPERAMYARMAARSGSAHPAAPAVTDLNAGNDACR